jgi:hypothetical protein
MLAKSFVVITRSVVCIIMVLSKNVTYSCYGPLTQRNWNKFVAVLAVVHRQASGKYFC